MWLFTTLGFFSCTRSAQDPELFQIRAREKGDLVGLINTLGVTCELMETRHTDYRWRVLVSEDQFHAIIQELAKRIDYSNFKQAVHDTPGQETKSGPYLRVWSAMKTLQDGQHGHVPPAWDAGTLFNDVEDPEDAAGIAMNETFPGFIPATPAPEKLADALKDPAEKPGRPKRKSRAKLEAAAKLGGANR